tara:strand:- start:137 stop:1276 length:1140 start_codon:yes stop_codon:yes gene_type:complete
MNINKIYSTVKKSIKSNSIDKYKFDYQKSKEKFRAILKDSSKKSKQLFLNSLKASNNVLLLSEKLFQNAQDRLEQRVQRSKEEVSVKPSTIWAQAITYSLIGGTTFGIGWLALAKTEEIVITQGKLEPIAGVIPIKIPLQGVTKQIFVKEGEKVKAGQLLIELDTEATRAKQDSLIKSKEINKNILDKLSYLLEEGAVSEVQYLQQKLQLNSIESEITKNNLTLKYQRIKAPIDGTVFNLIPQKPGYVANTGEPIMEIVPSDNLQARVEINSSKIGFVKVGKKADISIDSFPASDFGVIKGTVTRVSTDALKPDPRNQKGFRYPSNIKLETQYLKTESGKKLPLQAGMSLTANIKLRKVSYLQLLLGTFDSKANSLKEI